MSCGAVHGVGMVLSSVLLSRMVLYVLVFVGITPYMVFGGMLLNVMVFGGIQYTWCLVLWCLVVHNIHGVWCLWRLVVYMVFGVWCYGVW